MRILRTAGTAIVGSLIIAGIGAAQEKKIKRSDLPPAVEKTVEEVSKGGTIKGFSKESENGRTTYEVEMAVNGHSKDGEIDPSGVIVEV